jgi:ferredoxin
MSTTALIVVAVLILLSVVIKNFWCRYLCPYGAVMSLASLVSPFKIRRDAESCVDCGKCARACPQDLPVDRLIQVRSVECSACMECVAACATQSALQFALPPRTAVSPATLSIARRWSGRTLQPVAVVMILAALWIGGISLARITHHWQTNISDDVYKQLIPHADEQSHPGF